MPRSDSMDASSDIKMSPKIRRRSSVVDSLNHRISLLRSRLPASLACLLPELPPPTARNLWLCLMALVAIQNCWAIQLNFGSQDAVLALLLWGGGLICIEDQLEELRPRPGWLGLFLGTLLLLLVLARTAVVVSMNGVLFVLAPLAMLALTLLCQPFSCLWRFREALYCLLLLPVSKIIAWWVIPDEALSRLTASGAAFWLSILGFDVAVDGRKVFLSGGAVSVAGTCNGVEIIAMLVCICVIFLLAFPVRSRSSRCLLIVLAPVIAVISNTARIALLAILTTLGKSVGRFWFNFFHDQEGSLIFSGLAVFAFGLAYMRLLERELPPLEEDLRSNEAP